MPSLPYEILIRFDDAGNYKGGHTIRRDSITGKLSDAQPIGADKVFKWPAVVGAINSAALARVTEADAELAAEKAALAAKETAHATALAAKDTAAAAALAAREQALAAEKSAIEAQRQAAEAQRITAESALAEKEAALAETAAALSAEKPDPAVALARIQLAMQSKADRQKAELAALIAQKQAELDALG